MNKKFLATIIFVGLVIVALWIWTLATPGTMINIGGSASIDPLMQRLTNRYDEDRHKTFIYSSTGSNTGITNLQKGVYDLAFVSKDVTTSDFPGLTQLHHSDFFNEVGTPLGRAKFKENLYNSGAGYRYVTFTYEPIVFVYNIERTGLKQDDPFIDQFIFKLAQTLADPTLDANGQAIIKEIYKHDRAEDFISWYRLAQLLFAGSFDYSYISKETKVWPYASVPGSGTWTSFIKMTGTEPGQAVNKYGNNGSIFYQVLKSPGSFGFISMTYAQTIVRHEDSRKKLRTVGIQDSTGDTWWVYKDPSKVNYPLSRPFNVVFYVDTDPKHRAKMDAILNFVYWFCISTRAEPIFTELGLMQAMLDTQNFSWDELEPSLVLKQDYIKREESVNDFN